MKANAANADPAVTFSSTLALRVSAALGLLTLSAIPALSADAVSKETLEQRVIETARVIEKHPTLQAECRPNGWKGASSSSPAIFCS